jgi:PAS domain S-box-containing protein
VTPSSIAALTIAVEHAPVGVGVCDQDGNFVVVNDYLARLLRHDRESLLGKSFLTVIHPDEQAEVLVQVDRAMQAATVEGSDHGSDENEVRCIDGDGRTIWVHLTWTTTAPDEDGRQYTVVHVVDYSHRRVADDELIELRQLLHVAMEKSAFAIAISDMTKRITYANQQFCDLLGYSVGELTGMTFPDITHPDDRDKTIDAFEQMLLGKLERHQTIKRYVRKDGRQIYCRRIAIAARGRDGIPRSNIIFVESMGLV